MAQQTDGVRIPRIKLTSQQQCMEIGLAWVGLALSTHVCALLTMNCQLGGPVLMFQALLRDYLEGRIELKLKEHACMCQNKHLFENGQVIMFGPKTSRKIALQTINFYGPSTKVSETLKKWPI